MPSDSSLNIVKTTVKKIISTEADEATYMLKHTSFKRGAKLILKHSNKFSMLAK